MVQDDVMSISVGKYLVNWVNDLAFLITYLNLLIEEVD